MKIVLQCCHMDDVPKIGITGMPSVGKTDTLIKIIEKIEQSGYTVEGMITEPIIEKKKRVGFYVMDWQTKEKEVFAHLCLKPVGEHRQNLWHI